MAAVITDDVDLARRALGHYDVSADADLRLLNLSENATYLVTDGGEQSILRVHRQNYHRAHEIDSELDWLSALSAESDVTVPRVLPAVDGRRVVTVDTADVERHVVRFEMVAGAEPDETALTNHDFQSLGRITAALHDHAQGWQRPAHFQRFSWDWEHSLGDRGRWGRWRDVAGMGKSELRLLGRAEELLKGRLHAYGTGPNRFGLVHADLRLANLLVDPATDSITVIDFDDCGFGWYLYDFGTAVSFIEDDPALPEWQESWVAGYRSRRQLAAADEDMLASFVLLRRLLLVAWMGSHSHSKESATKAISYVEGSCELAERYLSSNGQNL